MREITIEVLDKDKNTLAKSTGHDETWLVYEPEYADGDAIRVKSDAQDSFLWLRLDDAMPQSLAFLPDGGFTYPVPFGEAKNVYSPRAFSGKRHCLYARDARREEIAARKNIAQNPWATHERSGLYPFASANVETRGESVFAAKNAIDGVIANDYHGEWPYTSWGINRDPDAALKLEFGRPVLLDEAVIYLRADFPHDAWWESARLNFSDGSEIELTLKKSAAGQRFAFDQRRVEWIVLDSLIKADDPSPFPALTQLELWGAEG